MSENDPIEHARLASERRRRIMDQTGSLEDPYTPGVGYPLSGQFTPDLYFKLANANRSLGMIGSNDAVFRPSRLPLIGRLIDGAKLQIHDLVLNYVRRLAVRQADINEHILRVVNELVATTAPGQAERLTALEQRIAELERQLDERGTPPQVTP